MTDERELQQLQARINRLIGAIEGKDALLRQYRLGRGSPPESAFQKIDALRPGDLERFPRAATKETPR